MKKPRPIRISSPALDLRQRHFEGSVHGILVVGTWLASRPGRSQPCMVLLHPTRPVAQGKTVPCVIALDQAWRWADDDKVGDPAHCARVINDWLIRGYLPGDVHNVKDRIRILKVVHARLPDLLNMPPRPKGVAGEQVAFGDVTMIDRQTGRVIVERELLTNV